MASPRVFILFSCIVIAIMAPTTLATLSFPLEIETSHVYTQAGDCMLMMEDMVSCIMYLSVGSKDTKPDQECCTGLGKILKTNSECVCEALKDSAELGFDLDMKRATGLPSACKIQGPSLSSCQISDAPNASPLPSPAHPPTTESSPLAPKPAPVSPKNHNPVPSPEAPAPVASSKSPSPIVSPTLSSPAPIASDVQGGLLTQHAPAPAPHRGGANYAHGISYAFMFFMMAAFVFYV